MEEWEEGLKNWEIRKVKLEIAHAKKTWCNNDPWKMSFREQEEFEDWRYWRRVKAKKWEKKERRNDFMKKYLGRGLLWNRKEGRETTFW